MSLLVARIAAMHRAGSGGGDTTHEYWRVYITANRGNTYTLVVELEFRDSVGGSDLTPLITSGADPNASRVLASSYYSANPPWKVFDGLVFPSSTPEWETSGVSPPHFIGYHFPVPVSIAQIGMVGRADSIPSRSPKDFALQYSDDGVTWTTVKAWTDVVFSSQAIMYDFTV